MNDRPVGKLIGTVLAYSTLALAAWQLAGPAHGVTSDILASPSPAAIKTPLAGMAKKPGSIADFGKLNLSFIQNRGQAPESVAWQVRQPGQHIAFSLSGLDLYLSQGRGDQAKREVIQVELLGAHTRSIETLTPAAGVVHYMTGPKDNWKTHIPTARAIVYRDAWDGIDIQYHGTGGKLESYYIVAPQSDPGQIRLRYRGQDRLHVAENGDLVLATPLGEVRETAPVLYQEIDGRRVSVEGRYRLLEDNVLGFQVTAYDRSRPLVIDPVLVYSGYLGGTDFDIATAVAVDGSGSAYVSGWTISSDFPVTKHPASKPPGKKDGFVLKLNPLGDSIEYAGYLGGSEDDEAIDIVVDAQGNAFVVGSTFSPDLPATNALAGDSDAFVARLNRDGMLAFVQYLGGSKGEAGSGIACAMNLERCGALFVAGFTFSADFPVQSGPGPKHMGGSDAFVTSMDEWGGIIYSGFLGGSWDDFAMAIAADFEHNAYVTGATESRHGLAREPFPVVNGPGKTHGGGSLDAFVTKLDAKGNIAYSGYLGGSENDSGLGIAVAPDHANDAVFVTGYTASKDFPVAGKVAGQLMGKTDAFVTRVDPTGTVLDYSVYFGGSGDESAFGVAVDHDMNAYITGWTRSPDLKPSGLEASQGFDPNQLRGGMDAFVAKLDKAGDSWTYVGYLGGSDDDHGSGIAVDASGNAYVVGATQSKDFPVTGSLSFPGDAASGFIAKIGEPAIQLQVNRTGHGGIVSDPAGIDCGVGTDCEEIYPLNTRVKLTARPAAYNFFQSWTGSACAGQGATCTLTMDAAKSVTANFLPAFYVRLGTVTGGRVDANPPTFDSSLASNILTYPVGRSVTLTAVPDAGNSFFGWGNGDCAGAGSNPVCVLTLNADKYVQAIFAPPVAALSVDAAPASPVIVGTPVLVTGQASGGLHRYEFRFELSGPSTGNTWQVVQNYSTSANWTWTPTAAMAGDNQIRVSVRNVGSTAASEQQVAIPFRVNGIIASLTATASPASPQTVGASTAIRGQATGGSGIYEYRFELNGPSTGGNWQVVQGYSRNAFWLWNLTAAMTGNNQVRVSARNAGSTLDAERQFTLPFVVNAAITGVTVSATPASPQVYGVPVQIRAQATGGSGNIEYRFDLSGPSTGNTLQTVQAYSPSATWNWTPTLAQAGQNQIVVYARNAGSTAQWEAYSSLIDNFHVLAPPTGVTIAFSPTSPQRVGTTITAYGQASGGYGGPIGYEYRFDLQGPSTGGIWQTQQAYSGNPGWTWNTTGVQSGTYQVRVYARTPGVSGGVLATGIMQITP